MSNGAPEETPREFTTPSVAQVEPVTFELVDGLLIIALADGRRLILARIADLEPLIELAGGS